MNRVWKAIGAVAIFVLIAFAGAIGKLLTGKISSGPTLSEAVEQAAAEVNKLVPTMVDGQTRLDRAAASQAGQVLTYSYTLVHISASEVASDGPAAMQAQTTKNLCAQKSKNLLRRGVALGVQYYSSDDILITEFVVHPSDCV